MVWRAFVLVASFLCGSLLLAQTAGPISADGRYALIAWNDLGMHCINPRFQDICLLPPANNVRAVVIRRGVEPSLVTNQTVRYVMTANLHPEQNTNFWTYANAIFGVNLAPGVGLAGNTTSGAMTVATDHYAADFVPVVPTNDAKLWNPFPVATVRLWSSTGTILAMTKVVVPVSDEMNCQKCHATGGIAALGLAFPTLEQNILKLHDIRNGTHLMGQRPVLCSRCHADPALGQAGHTGVESLSLAMHSKHASLAQQPACYDCHPGARTQCNRSAIAAMGPVSATDPGCANCHGNLSTMATGLKNGRQPWLQEPTCAQCHGAAYSTGTVLFRNAKGHGGIQCIVCHGSPHAWWPSRSAADNWQPMTLQGNSHALGYNGCGICHTDGRTGTMPPHGGD